MTAIERAISYRSAACRIAAALLWVAALTPPDAATARDWLPSRHGLSAFGDLKYPPGFAHFDYVDVDARTGGEIVTNPVHVDTVFDTLNPYALTGAAPMGLAAPHNFVYDTLMARADDEPDAVYGLVARSARMAADGSGVEFELRPEARFADGAPLTAADIVFTWRTLRGPEAAPRFRLALQDVVAAEAIDPHRVRFDFAPQAVGRDLSLLVATLPILSEAWFDGRRFAETTETAPMGSGPYRVESVIAGRSITYRRREDYWAADLAVNVGRWNFDRITIVYGDDDVAATQALAAGHLDFLETFTARGWALAQDIDAVGDGRVVTELLPDARPSGTQGFWFNTRRAALSDRRVREALALAFDFEWSNRTLFNDQFARTESFFQNTELAADGPAGPRERALLEPFADRLPDGVLDAAASPPRTDGSGRARDSLRHAARLLDDAGWTAGTDGFRRNAAGAPLEVTFVNDSIALERVIRPYVENLRALGVDARHMLVDAAEMQRRRASFDYDVIVARFALPMTPGVGLRNLYHSSSAAQPGSYNLSGVADPVVDNLVEAMIGARSRADLVAAGRALDRVLRVMHIWTPNWFRAAHMVAYRTRFGRPATKPRYSRGVLDTWWVDPERQAASRRP